MKFFLSLIFLQFVVSGSRINSFDILNEQEASSNKDEYEIIPDYQINTFGQQPIKCYLSIKTNQVHCFST